VCTEKGSSEGYLLFQKRPLTACREYPPAACASQRQGSSPAPPPFFLRWLPPVPRPVGIREGETNQNNAEYRPQEGSPPTRGLAEGGGKA